MPLLGPWEIYRSMRAGDIRVSLDGHGAGREKTYPRVLFSFGLRSEIQSIYEQKSLSQSFHQGNMLMTLGRRRDKNKK
jgi:hypothetical protein